MRFFNTAEQINPTKHFVIDKALPGFVSQIAEDADDILNDPCPQSSPASVILYGVCDLGLIASDRTLRIANSIYHEIIPREPMWNSQEQFTSNRRGTFCPTDTST